MTVAESAPPGRLRSEGQLRRLASRPEFGALMGALLVFLVFSILGGGVLDGTFPSKFLSSAGIAGWLQIAAQIGILGSTVTLLMIAGEFDLSVGATIGAAGMFLAMLMGQFGISPVIAVPTTFAFALGIGAVNGWLVIKTRLPSFIVTLGTQLVLRGATIALTRAITAQTIVNVPADAKANPILQIFTANVVSIGQARFNAELLWWIAVVVVASWILTRTKFGNWIYAVGGSAQAARYVGVPVNRVKIILFMATAASAALYACIVVPSVGSANVVSGTNKEFEAIITAVVGGTLLTGGYGSVIGSALGAFILGATNLGIFFAGINTDWYNVVLGSLLLIAVLVNTLVLRRASGAR
ncbi:MAG TPA: ABC transporter permease [Candidatus Limnocylindrales bacterium]